MARVITIAGLKGGVGKSVSAVHLALYLERRYGEGSALLVDGDPNATVTDWARGKELGIPVVTEYEAMSLARDYKWAVLDTKARPEAGYLERISKGAEFLVLPTPPSVANLRVLVKTVEELRGVGRDGGYKALLTLVPPWPNRDGEKARRTLVKAGIPLFDGEIRRRQVFEKAVHQGVPVYEVKERAAGGAWRDYEEVGQELLREIGGADG